MTSLTFQFLKNSTGYQEQFLLCKPGRIYTFEDTITDSMQRTIDEVNRRSLVISIMI